MGADRADRAEDGPDARFSLDADRRPPRGGRIRISAPRSLPDPPDPPRPIPIRPSPSPIHLIPFLAFRCACEKQNLARRTRRKPMRRGEASASFRVSLFTSASPREPPSFPQCTRDSGKRYDPPPPIPILPSPSRSVPDALCGKTGCGPVLLHVPSGIHKNPAFRRAAEGRYSVYPPIRQGGGRADGGADSLAGATRTM